VLGCLAVLDWWLWMRVRSELCSLPGALRASGVRVAIAGLGSRAVVLEPARVGRALGLGVMLGILVDRWWMLRWRLLCCVCCLLVVAPSFPAVCDLRWVWHWMCFLVVSRLQLACVATAWCRCACAGGCLCAFLLAYCSLLPVALCALRHCPARCF
jgi:hypothetical protein